MQAAGSRERVRRAAEGSRGASSGAAHEWRPNGTAGEEAGSGDRPGEGTRDEPPGHKLRIVSTACYVPLLLRNNN